MTRIAIAVIATGPYAAFVAPLITSARELLFTDCDREFLIFVDQPELQLGADCRVFSARHEPWPLVTLRRFTTLLAAEQRIAACDHFLFLDADMRVAATIAPENVFDHERPLTGVQHPYVAPGSPYPLERDPRSSAFVAKGHEAGHYWQGCLWGGQSSMALAMIRELAARVAADEARGIIARWHDESHLNRYFTDRASQVKTLDPGYALPHTDISLPYPPRIFHIVKDDRALGNFGDAPPRRRHLARAGKWLRNRRRFRSG